MRTHDLHLHAGFGVSNSFLAGPTHTICDQRVLDAQTIRSNFITSRKAVGANEGCTTNFRLPKEAA